MNLEWLIFDIGGVMIELDFDTPRNELAARLGMTREALDQILSSSFTEDHGSTTPLRHIQCGCSRLCRKQWH